jgi:long-chain acyl-CoA synthetase
MKIKIQELFGMTEGTSILSVVRGNDKLKFGTVGRPVLGVEFKIAEDGEILYKSSGVFCGYLKDQNATNATVKEGWLYSGDIGELDKDGYLKITDRKKDIIITSGGKNVSPIAIENRLKFSPFIKEAIVIGDKRKYISALIEVEMDTLQNWAQRNNIPYTTFRSLAENPQVHELIRKEIEDANKDFNPVEKIRKFYLLTKELDHDDDELTATMKVRRNIIEGKFKEIIDKLYKS